MTDARVPTATVAGLPARVAAELLGRLEPFRFRPRVVLDLGAGDGRASAQLKRRYPRALVVALDLAPAMLRAARRYERPWRRFARVCADARSLPLKDGAVDLVVSSLMLEWCEPLTAALGEVRRVLAPGGFFAFSTLGGATLHELRAAWAEADSHDHVLRFPDLHALGAALMQAGLSEPVLDVDRIETTYDDPLALMRELRAARAGSPAAGRPRGLVGRARLARMRAGYEPFRRNGRLPATFEVVYGASWAGNTRAAATSDGRVVRIAPDAIGRSRSPRSS